jgi:Acetyltransferase (GNAT) family.
MIDIKRTACEDKDFLALVKMLDADLAIRDGEEHIFYAQFNKPVGLTGVVVAHLDNVPVGCGAFKRYSDETAEIKRMFVVADARGKRIGGDILAELERWSTEEKYSECILETGLKQPEAIALYKRSGYEIIPNYGQYAGVENSVCMRKVLL